MTRKRYTKLAYALMQRIGQEYPMSRMGEVLKNVQKITFDKIKFNSYAEAWEHLESIRSQYGM